LAVVLVDARHGVVEQTRRHVAVAALLKVPHVVLAVNKMDLVDYQESVFAPIADEFAGYAKALGVPEVTAIPISALAGDNVVDPSNHMDWYPGPTLLEHLENVDVDHDPQYCAARFPVQYVLRPQSSEHRDYRGYAGQVTAGAFRPGDEVVVLPSGRRTSIAGIDRLGEQDVEIAYSPQSVTLRLADDVDVSRGDVIAAADRAPAVSQDITATVCHIADRPLRAGDRVLLRHGTATVKAIVRSLDSTLNLETLRRDPHPAALHANDIGQITVRAAAPLPLDDYADHRRTGSFLLIDDADGTTLTAGMVGVPLGTE
jgi:sulfate adenylyltransferase subunit 1